MAAACDPAARKGARRWASIIPRSTKVVLKAIRPHPRRRRGKDKKDDYITEKPKESYWDSRDTSLHIDPVNVVSDDLPSLDASIPNGDCSPTPSELDVPKKPLEVERRTVSREQSRTFPQSIKEMERNPIDSSSIDAIIRATGREVPGIENVARPPGTRLGRLQTVPEGSQEADSREKKGLYERFDTQLKELQAAMRKEYGQKQSTENDSRRFVEIWESKLLPTIEQVLDDNVEGEYSISVTRTSDPRSRIIVILTAIPITGDVEQQVEDTKSEILPSDLNSTTTITFREGGVQRLHPEASSPSRVSTWSSEDSCVSARNTAWSENPAIGDSVGWEGETASLGPLLQIDKAFYRLVCWHLFDDNGENRRCINTQPPQGLSTLHPSLTDSGNQRGTQMGDVVAYSGLMYETSRRSICIRQDPSAQAMTDWALIESPDASQRRVNIVRRQTPGRRSTNEGDDNVEIEITKSLDPESFRLACENSQLPPLVYSVGRTSGYTTGLLGMTYGRQKLRNGDKTKNWTVDNVAPQSETDIREWIRAGMGLPGDSGAGVFGFWNNELLGQIWARNIYEKKSTEPRIVFFTAMDDIYADIADRMPGAATTPAQLPTPESIKDSVNLESGREFAAHDAMTHDAMFKSDYQYPSRHIRELDDADLDDDGPDEDQFLKHRSAATSTSTSQRLKSIAARSKRASWFEPPKWAKLIIHAATF